MEKQLLEQVKPPCNPVGFHSEIILCLNINLTFHKCKKFNYFFKRKSKSFRSPRRGVVCECVWRSDATNCFLPESDHQGTVKVALTLPELPKGSLLLLNVYHQHYLTVYVCSLIKCRVASACAEKWTVRAACETVYMVPTRVQSCFLQCECLHGCYQDFFSILN